MCGRYASARSVEDLATTFGISAGDVDVVPAADWNIAPTKSVPAVLVRDGRPVLTGLRWGLVPSWAQYPGTRSPTDGATLFNARLETVEEKPAFRDAVRRRRCLLPADGWYEWARRPDGRRIPHFLTSADGDLLALAGVWEACRDADGHLLRSVAILTGAAQDRLSTVHDRAPVVIEPDDWHRWTDPDADAREVRALLRPTPSRLIRMWPVSDRVGDVRAAGADLAAPVRIDEQPALF